MIQTVGDTDGKWLTSKETQKHLKISGCELMHQREAGKLIFRKIGNAYSYLIPETKRNGN